MHTYMLLDPDMEFRLLKSGMTECSKKIHATSKNVYNIKTNKPTAKLVITLDRITQKP